MKVATWNVNGIRARFDELRAWLAQEQPDICCLQEVKAAPDQVPLGVLEMDGYWHEWHGDRGYSGVAILCRQSFVCERPLASKPAFDFEHRILELRLPEVRVASVYVPNGGKDYEAKLRFLDALAGYAAEATTGLPFLVCGDLNVTRTDRDVHPKERKANAVGQRPDERERFERVLGHGLVDVARALDPDNDELFTWWAPWRNLRQRNIGWRIDYVLASEVLGTRATACRSLREVGTSDHAPVVAEFGPGRTT